MDSKWTVRFLLICSLLNDWSESASGQTRDHGSSLGRGPLSDPPSLADPLGHAAQQGVRHTSSFPSRNATTRAAINEGSTFVLSPTSTSSDVGSRATSQAAVPERFLSVQSRNTSWSGVKGQAAAPDAPNTGAPSSNASDVEGRATAHQMSVPNGSSTVNPSSKNVGGRIALREDSFYVVPRNDSARGVRGRAGVTEDPISPLPRNTIDGVKTGMIFNPNLLKITYLQKLLNKATASGRGFD